MSYTDMSDSEKQDHWGALASDLGIEPPKEEVVVSPQPPPLDEGRSLGHTEEDASASGPVVHEPMAEEPHVVRAEGYVGRPPQGQRSADEWARLATTLGIVPPEEPAAPPAPEPEAVAKPSCRESALEPAQRAEGMAEAWTESVIELMEESEEAGPPADQPQAAPAETDQRRSDRRRRKRRRRPRRPSEGEADTPREMARSQRASESDSESDQPEDEMAELPGVAVTPQPVGQSMSRAERPKRGRRRRGERRRDRDQPKGPGQDDLGVAPEGFESHQLTARPPSAADREAEQVETAQHGDEADEHDHDLDDLDKPGKDGHRAIPSWEEAISHIVSKNLEARARKPDSGHSRSRGGRGRG